MTITVSIETDNDAFRQHGTREVARILKEATAAIRAYPLGRVYLADGTPLRDVNGNTVGKIRVAL